MNSRRLAAVGVIAVLALLSSAQMPLVAGGSEVISVSGEAELRVVPDEVLLSLGVESFDKVLKTAKAQNDAAIKRAIDVARGQGVQPEHIQTDYIGIEPKYERGDITRALLGYEVRKTILIRLKDIRKFEDLLTGALEAGVTHVHGIEFRTTDLRKHRDAARVLAIKAAQEKAALLARESGRSLGKVQSIGESNYGYFSSYGSWWGSRYNGGMAQNVMQNVGGMPLESDSTLAPGQISIRVSVHASYALQ
jgi:uncharacterized protein YggE